MKQLFCCAINRISLICLLFISLMSMAFAACQVSNSPSGCPFTATATIQNGCLVSGSGSSPQFGTLNFGTVSALATNVVSTSITASTSYTLNCTPNMSLTMSIDGGVHYNSARQVALNNKTLIYRLYSDPAYQNSIGVNQNVTIGSVGAGTNITLPVYAQLQLTGTVPPGTYTDTLTVTLSW